MSINVSDADADSPYLAANDWPVGKVFPLMTIERVEFKDVPVPGKKDKKRKIVLFFKGASKGWAANKQCLRELGATFGATEDIDTKWIGCRVSIKVVGDVKRPDGTKGNALRIAKAEKA